MSDRKRTTGDRSQPEEAQHSIPAAHEPPDELDAIKAQVPERKSRFLRIAGLTILGPFLAIGLGLYLYLTGGRYVTQPITPTSNRTKIAVSTDISGRVSEVLVRSNQVVKPGDVLFRIDAEPFQLAVDEAKAKVARPRSKTVRCGNILYREKLASHRKGQG